MSESASDNIVVSDTKTNNGTEKTVKEPATSLPEKASYVNGWLSSDESPFAFSDTLFFPIPTTGDAICQSSTIIPDTLLDEDIFDHEEQSQDEANLFSLEQHAYYDFEGETSEEDANTSENQHQRKLEEDADAYPLLPSSVPAVHTDASVNPMVSTDNPKLQSTKNDSRSLMHVDSTTQHEMPRLSTSAADRLALCEQNDIHAILAVDRLLRATEKSPQMSRLHRKIDQLNLPGADADAEEIEKKMESGLQLLDDLIHADSSDNKELKSIYESYYNFTQALFEDVKEPCRAEGSSKPEEQSPYVELGDLEKQKEDIAEQEKLLEKEILHYKATKRELKKVAERLEEASKSYRKPDILEDVVIPKDIKLSSSSEYVAEIEELQREILLKQETLEEIRREIQHHYLPKSLVDSVCESHRLAMLSLRDIEEENAYLKECISRLDLQYLYSLQVS